MVRLAAIVTLAFSPALFAQPVRDELPSVFAGDRVMPPQEFAGIVNGTAKANQRTVFMDRRTGLLANAVVGIETYGYTMEIQDQVTFQGSGFFIDPCHILTANHVAKPGMQIPKRIVVGWGPPPSASAPGDPQNTASEYLKASFSTIRDVTPEYYGPSAMRTKDIEEPTGPGDVFGRPKIFGDATSGDWTILRLKTCRSAGEPYFRLPRPPFDPAFPVTDRQWTTYAGYPLAKYDRVNVSRCLPFAYGMGGILASCPLAAGGSGGVLMNRSGEATGLLSTGIDIWSTSIFVPTQGAAAALYVGEQDEPKRGCLADLKKGFQILNPAIPDNMLGEGDTMTVFDEMTYAALAQGIGKNFGGMTSLFMPAKPDRVWCETLNALARKDKELSLGVDTGEWHDGDLDLAIGKDRNGPTVTVRVSRSKYENAGVVPLGRMVFVRAFKGTTMYQWIVELFPGKPPFLVAVPAEGYSVPRAVWMQPGRRPASD